jgi:hypothetical protein
VDLSGLETVRPKTNRLMKGNDAIEIAARIMPI